VNTTPQSNQPTPRELVRREQRRRMLRTMSIWILGPVVLATIYYAVITPPQYETDTSFTIRGQQTGTGGILTGLVGATAPSSTDPQLVTNYLMSSAPIPRLRAAYGLTQAYERFTLDPFAYLSPNATKEWTTWFWNTKMKVAYTSTSGDVAVRVLAYTPQESYRLTLGVLDAAKRAEDSLNALVAQGSLNLANEQVASTKRDYDAATKKLTELQGNVNTLTIGADAAAAVSLVGQIDSQLATLKVSQAAVQAAFQPDAPQSKTIQQQIASLEAQRIAAMAQAKSAPGSPQAEHDIQVQAALLDYQFAQKNYFAAEGALVAAQPENQTQSFVVSYIPPTLPETSDYWLRFLNVVAIGFASALLLGAGSLIFSVVKDHLQ
jgi:capsular polysaccharide transport system permease protein